jgi:hypothetical protein
MRSPTPVLGVKLRAFATFIVENPGRNAKVAPVDGTSKSPKLVDRR